MALLAGCPILRAAKVEDPDVSGVRDGRFAEMFPARKSVPHPRQVGILDLSNGKDGAPATGSDFFNTPLAVPSCRRYASVAPHAGGALVCDLGTLNLPILPPLVDVSSGKTMIYDAHPSQVTCLFEPQAFPARRENPRLAVWSVRPGEPAGGKVRPVVLAR